VIVELGVAERIIELYCTAHFWNGSGGALHVLVFSVEFVDQIQSLCVIMGRTATTAAEKLTCQYSDECRYCGYKE